VAELLFWPALLAYGEAAFAYFREARARTAGRLATWGVRIGWLAQTRAAHRAGVACERIPWSTWAGSLNLFVWLVVTAYLIWGCRARYRLLGLCVTPLVAALFVVARLGGGTELGTCSHYSNVFLVLHVGLVLTAFAGFTLGRACRRVPVPGTAAQAARRRHPPPPCSGARTLDGLGGGRSLCRCRRSRSAWSSGSSGSREKGGGLDALMAVTLATWLAYRSYLALRYAYGWQGRGTAYFALAAFALVIVVRLALPATHFA
jgi:ABC-type transport system involved in cytochrome c biogenesis permease subunit